MIECTTGREQDCPGEAPIADRSCNDTRCTSASLAKEVTFQMFLSFLTPLSQEEELLAIQAIAGVIAFELAIDPSMVVVRKAPVRRLQLDLPHARSLGIEMKLLVEIKKASLASVLFLMSDGGQERLMEDIKGEMVQQGLPEVALATIQQAAPTSSPSPSPFSTSQQSGDTSEGGSSVIAIVISVLVSFLLLLGLPIFAKYRQRSLKKRCMAHRSVEGASLKQVTEDSSDSDPGSPTGSTHPFRFSRLSKWWQVVKKLSPFASSHRNHRRLKPEDKDVVVVGEVLHSPSGSCLAKVSQSPLKPVGNLFVVACPSCGNNFNEGELFCTRCGRRRPEEVTGKSSQDDSSSEGDSTRPPTSASLSTAASAMSALRSIAQQAEWETAPGAPSETVPGHRATASQGSMTWTPVNSFGGMDPIPAPLRPPLPAPPDLSLDAHRNAVGSRVAAEHRRQVAPPPRRRVAPEPATVPSTPQPSRMKTLE
jgi:hypothetical protein